MECSRTYKTRVNTDFVKTELFNLTLKTFENKDCSVISSDPPSKDENAWLTMVFSDQFLFRYQFL